MSVFSLHSDLLAFDARLNLELESAVEHAVQQAAPAAAAAGPAAANDSWVSSKAPAASAPSPLMVLPDAEPAAAPQVQAEQAASTAAEHGDAAHPTLPVAPRPMNPATEKVPLPALDALDPRINQWAFENLNAPNYAGFVSQFQNRSVMPWDAGLERHYGTISDFDYRTGQFSPPRDSGVHSQADLARNAMSAFLSTGNINQHLFSYFVIGSIDGCFGSAAGAAPAAPGSSTPAPGATGPGGSSAAPVPGPAAQSPGAQVQGDAAHPTLPTAPRPMNPASVKVPLPGLDSLDPRINQWAFENLNAPNYAAFVSQFEGRAPLEWNAGLDQHYGWARDFDYRTRTFGPLRDTGIHSQAALVRATMSAFLATGNINQHLFSYFVIGGVDGTLGRRG